MFLKEFFEKSEFLIKSADNNKSMKYCSAYTHFSSLITLSISVLQEKRIYDLKKKNQELEKFKFVLDYKIKELKKQIEPRESDINNMKEQIQEVRPILTWKIMSGVTANRFFKDGLKKTGKLYDSSFFYIQ